MTLARHTELDFANLRIVRFWDISLERQKGLSQTFSITRVVLTGKPGDDDDYLSVSLVLARCFSVFTTYSSYNRHVT